MTELMQSAHTFDETVGMINRACKQLDELVLDETISLEVRKRIRDTLDMLGSWRYREQVYGGLMPPDCYHSSWQSRPAEWKTNLAKTSDG
jgi:hypothetical protein